MSRWKQNVKDTIEGRESTIKKIGKKNKKGYLSVTMNNGDTGETHFQAIRGLEEGTDITYTLQKIEFEDTTGEKDAFLITKVTDIRPKNAGTSVRELRGIDVGKLMFIDIETASTHKTLVKKNNPEEYQAWEAKMSRKHKEDLKTNQVKAMYKTDATLYPEFSKITCISIGMIKNDQLVVNSYYGEDENQILMDFAGMCNKLSPKYKLCGHSIKGYDIPFIMKRLIINGIPVPEIVDTTGLKPWELTFLVDTNEVWRSSSYTGSSLAAICTAMGIPSPKVEMDGSMASETYHDGKLDEVAQYCEKDVLATANVTLRMMGQSVLTEGDVKSLKFSNDEEEE